MTGPVSWVRSAADGAARSGVMSTPHGAVETPGFMAVGTRATVKTLDTVDLEGLGAQIVLANTYHLMLRPGHDVVSGLGELHGFMAWDKPIGSKVVLSPERSVEIQEALGADIAMVLDVPVNLPASRGATEREMRRTLRWAERSKAAKQRSDRALFGIVQGGADRGLREISAVETADIGFPGFGIGGLVVGEGEGERAIAIDAVVPALPVDAVRYVMGLGDTEGILDAVGRGIDLFDCVLPTRLARHGKALTRTGDLSMRRTEWTNDASPIEEDCPCIACRRYSRGYIRHLVITKELLANRLLTLHNLAYTYRLMDDIRSHIVKGSFGAFAEDVTARRRQGIGRSDS